MQLSTSAEKKLSNFKNLIANLFPANVRRREQHELGVLYKQVHALYRRTEHLSDPKEKEQFIWIVVTNATDETEVYNPKLIESIERIATEVVAISRIFDPPKERLYSELSVEEAVTYRTELRRLEKIYSDEENCVDELFYILRIILKTTMEELPAVVRKNRGGEDGLITVSLIDLIDNAHEYIEKACNEIFSDELDQTKVIDDIVSRVKRNTLIASDTDLHRWDGDPKRLKYASHFERTPIQEVVDMYLGGTPFADIFKVQIPFSIPTSARFEHCHVLGGTGHGKTQFLQSLLIRDIQNAVEGNCSVMVIDGQGDLIRKITNLALFDPNRNYSAADRLVYIDPTDIDYPACLNMFDFNHERLATYSAVDQERIYNATIDLYEYFFGALLGAEMTQKQDVIFKYLARLMFKVPDATIHTLLDVMENGEAFQPYIDQLDGTSQRFFRTQFFNKSFDDTKEQIARRLWGILSNGAMERMFNNKRNKVDIFDAINRGSVILVNTAKDLLQADGSAIMGRFFLALLVQAAVQRQTMHERDRLDTFAYIDEIQDYIAGDNKVEELLNQARKYRVSLLGAHQNLGQLSLEQQATFASSTSIKFLGGVSAKDARALASDMRCSDDFLLSMKKEDRRTNFACFVKNVTPKAIKVSVPFGQMEQMERTTAEGREVLINMNRKAYCAMPDDREVSHKPQNPSGSSNKGNQDFSLGKHEVI